MQKVQEQMQWDVFISHAWEDKESFARPLAMALRRESLAVWFDEFALRVGDSLRRSIDRGLADSRFGVVILSPHFFAKEWTKKELDGLIAREITGEKVILPIWHNITADEIRKYSPLLTDRVAVSSSRGIEYVVTELLRAIRPAETRQPTEQRLRIRVANHELVLGEQYREVWIDARLVYLTALEARTLAYLNDHRGQTCSSKEMVETVWESRGALDLEDLRTSLHLLINHLRIKVEPDPKSPIFIRSHRGRGFGFSLTKGD